MALATRRIVQLSVLIVCLLIAFVFIRTAMDGVREWQRSVVNDVTGNSARDQATRSDAHSAAPSSGKDQPDTTNRTAGQPMSQQAAQVARDRNHLIRFREDALAKSGKKNMEAFCAQFIPGTDEHNLYCAPLP